MLLRYYKQSELAFTNRKRYLNIERFGDDYTEETQLKVTLGDGAQTSVKTNANNICNYVVMEDTARNETTRWYVYNYTYVNGGQVILNLQRDIIGEKGIDNMFGKIERGWTDTFLKNRKELSLNQRLVNRTPLKPKTNKYGNFSVSTHDNEAWGILYFKRPESNVTINITGYTPETVSYPVLDTSKRYCRVKESNMYQEFLVAAYYEENYNGYMPYNVRIEYYFNSQTMQFAYNISTALKSNIEFNLSNCAFILTVYNSTLAQGVMRFAQDIASQTISGLYKSSFSLPDVDDTLNFTDYSYDGKVVYNNTTLEYEFYSIEDEQQIEYYTGSDNISLKTNIARLNLGSQYYYCSTSSGSISCSSYLSFFDTKYKTRSSSEVPSGSIELTNSTGSIIDEPFIIFACPLYNVTVSNGNNNYIIEKGSAFSFFNELIEKTSGENGYLVDAQIYPYCPDLESVATLFIADEQTNIDFPLFSVVSNTYTRISEVQLYPSADIKKEYIQREYSIISPDQTNKFTFNFYDYNGDYSIEPSGEINVALQQFAIKTCLKPFAVLTSCVIIPTDDSLIGITYDSDLRGCKPSSNGFECSLSSDAFETYKRQNSNYEKIFDLSKQELEKQHQVESVNEVTSGIVNTTTAMAMGAIGGFAAGGFPAAVVGGVAAGATVGVANTIQHNVNEDLRQYERELQQERFDLSIGTIKNLPDTITRISSFNEIILRDFYYVVETYECSEKEKEIVDTFIKNYGYGIGVYGYFTSFCKKEWFLRGVLISSNLMPNVHNIAQKELNGGIYIYE